MNELVLVRRDGLIKRAQLRVSVAGFYISEDLVVGAVFLDNIDHVLEEAGFANTFRDGARRLTWARRQGGLGEQRKAHICQGLRGENGQVRSLRSINQ